MSTSSRSLSTLLAEAARARPGATAVIDDPDRRVSYAELAALAGRVQAGLNELAVRKGDRVVVLAERTDSSSVAAVHAILASGAVYVPLDPLSPPARWAAVSEVCEPVAVVGDSALLDRFAQAVPRPRRLALDGDLPAAALAPVPVDGREVAYLLPTSGSTGVPKCVALTGDNGIAFLEWMVGELGISPTDRFACDAPLHFDVSVAAVLGTAMAGAALAPVPRGLSTFAAELSEWMARQATTVWISVPYPLSRLSALDLDTATERLAALRTVVFAGDVFPHLQLGELMRRTPRARFVNIYGPTETNGCTFEVVDAPPTEPVPIGRAIDCAECWVEDDGRRVDEVGAVGELVVAGPTVAAGYWGDAGQNGTRFRRYPGGRAYATGDQVRILPGHRYAFLGRVDNMIKLRGQRFELEEVENVLRTAPGVRECCVAKVDVRGDHVRLLAAVVGPVPDASALRAHCRTKLPAWAVPHEFVAVSELPLGSTGKVDRRKVGELLAEHR
ncbi:amino acid adenylation domain-containing protein [Allokutzneria sp. A3M-2-11 16]|uniref:amino acid adenylation domain-containing protein n=1 Tax=Allokutzneria sp. A3M-2-11 16 TaxID=2962043 RepID=UPI0020B70A4F|nr:amino acid adenylation domain-containing protein [Allokutzneria sp. A3M-2-11 16]MCP3801908.1 amino acid adenylation domain-containing protein [Allokutzneria sp. A3M-2-11 16]